MCPPSEESSGPVLLDFGLAGGRSAPHSDEPLAGQAVELAVPDARQTEAAASLDLGALSDAERTVRWVEDGNESLRLLSIANSSPEELLAGYELMVGKVPQRRSEVASFVEAFSPEASRRQSSPTAS
jgi:hypothetical protein